LRDQCDGHHPCGSCKSRNIICQFDSTKDGRKKEGRELILRGLKNEQTLFEDFLHALITAPDETHDAFMTLIQESESTEIAKLCVFEWSQQEKETEFAISENLHHEHSDNETTAQGISDVGIFHRQPDVKSIPVRMLIDGVECAPSPAIHASM